MEGPTLARYFLSHTFNLLGGADEDDGDGHNGHAPRRGRGGMESSRSGLGGKERSRNLARILFERGFRDSAISSGPARGWEEQVGGILRDYALAKVAEYLGGEVGDGFRVEVEAVVEVIIDCYEEYIRKHVLELCEGDAAEQDMDIEKNIAI